MTKEPGRIAIEDVESVDNLDPSQPALHTSYITFLRDHEPLFKNQLARVMDRFNKATSGYIGLVDDVGNLQIRHWVGDAGAFIQFRANEGTAGYAIRANRPYLWRGDAKNTTDPYFIPSDTNVRSELVAPIRVGDGVAGVILLDSHASDCFDAEDAERSLQVIANQIGEVLKQAPEKPKRLGLIQRPKEIEEVLGMTSSIFVPTFSDSEDYDYAQTMAQRILACAMEITGAMRGNIAMIDNTYCLKIVARRGDTADNFKNIDLHGENTGIKGWVIRNNKAFYAPNVKGNVEKGYSKIPFYVPTHESVLSELAVPLIGDNSQAIGVINLESDNEHAFEVELENPADGRTITGGRHFTLFSTLAVIGARAVAISERFQDFRKRQQEAIQKTNQLGNYSKHAMYIILLTHQLNSKSVNETLFTQIFTTLIAMLDAPNQKLSMTPFDGEDFMQNCVALDDVIDEHKVQYITQGGGYLRASQPLLELAVRLMISEIKKLQLNQQPDSNSDIEIILNLRSDPVLLIVHCKGITIDCQVVQALEQNNIEESILGPKLWAICLIARWHEGNLSIKEHDEHSLVLSLPRR